ncbi:MAG: radical SAM protein [Spirochaetes bacterium]|nr:radical SAM protein [Spirochaetota bacterium]
MKHIDFHISYQCINKCIFCSSSDSIETFHDHPLDYKKIISLLKEKRKKFNSVHFTGGEPTLYPFFGQLVERAKQMGYKIAVGTNGAGFADKRFCTRTASFISEVCFSFHGHTAALHNLHTQNKKSFDIVNRAVKNLSEFDLYLMSNTVITKYNAGHLDKILSFLKKKKIKQVLLSNLAPEGRGLKNYRRILVRLKEIEKMVPGLVKLADDLGLVLRFFGLPACILGEYAEHSNDFFWDPRLNIELVREREKIFPKQEKGWLPIRSRIKTPTCRRCSYRNICGGIFQEYNRIFKDSELKTR